MKFTNLLLFILIFNITVITAQDLRYGITDMHGSYIERDVILLDEDSVPVRLNKLLNKPTILAFVYYKCPGICNTVLDGIAEVINKSNLNLIKDYQVLTVSIQNTEGPSLARLKKNNYLKLVKKKDARDGWKFFTADSLSISRLTKSAGFQFQKLDSTIIHPSVLIIISPQGKICRYLYGTYYLPMELEMTLVDAKKEIANASRIKSFKYCYGSKPNNDFPSNKFIIICYSTFALLIFGILYWMIKVKIFKT